jgi:hypothetical protein
VIVTTNYKLDGIFLPPDDARNYAAWSELTKNDFPSNYWDKLWHWYDHENGIAHVAAFLEDYDLSDWSAKKPPPRTEWWHAIVGANASSEDAELLTTLDRLKKPPAITLLMLLDHERESSFGEWLKDRKNRRAIPHRLEHCGYVQVRNPTCEDGLWVVQRVRCASMRRKN